MSNEPPAQRPRFAGGYMSRPLGDFILIGVTAIELWLLIKQTPTFTLTDWIYVSSNVLVLLIALARRPAREQDRSIGTLAAVIVSYAYPYAQVVVLRWAPGHEAWPAGGLVLVI